jgi:hypothetical protein
LHNFCASVTFLPMLPSYHQLVAPAHLTGDHCLGFDVWGFTKENKAFLQCKAASVTSKAVILDRWKSRLLRQRHLSSDVAFIPPVSCPCSLDWGPLFGASALSALPFFLTSGALPRRTRLFFNAKQLLLPQRLSYLLGAQSSLGLPCKITTLPSVQYDSL